MDIKILMLNKLVANNMTTRILLITTVVVAATVLASYWYVSNHRSGDIVTFKVAYMNYACGDCYSQYQVREIVAAKRDYSYLKGVDINVGFIDQELEKRIERETEHCQGCYHYIVEGILDSSSTGYDLKATNVYVINLFSETDSTNVKNKPDKLY